MSDETPPRPPTTPRGALPAGCADDLLTLDAELVEVDLLITQAKTEAARHETRRSAAAEKLAALPVRWRREGAARSDDAASSR